MNKYKTWHRTMKTDHSLEIIGPLNTHTKKENTEISRLDWQCNRAVDHLAKMAANRTKKIHAVETRQ